MTFGQNYGAVTPPVAFSNYLGAKVTTTATVAAGDTFYLMQRIEGFNVADLNWGSANAKSVTVSFWAYSSATGTFGGAIQNNASTRSYVFTYSIPVANTWTYATITISGDTTGTWLTTNGIGIQLAFSYGSGTSYSITAGAWAAGNFTSATGAVNLLGTSNATLYITGVQLESGTIATPYEFNQYQVQLAQCQRYYQTVQSLMMNGVTTAQAIMMYFSKVPFRATPTISLYSASPYVESVPWNTTGSLTSASVSASHLTVNGGDISISGTFSPATSYGSVWLLGGQGTTVVSFTAEL